MCGRYVMAADPGDLVALFEVDEVGDLPERSWNVAPTDRAPVVVEPPARDDGPPIRRLEAARWGLVPPWAPDLSGAARAINARSETVAERRTFAPSLATRRAIVPVSGWYEWRKPERTPFLVHAPGDAPIGLAGLYAWWKGPDGAWVLTSTILTAEATGTLADLHDRMPVVLAPELWDTWLDAETEGGQDLVDAVVAAAAEQVPALSLREVSRAVGDVRADGPSLVEPVG
ncbi:SOS response-associated peptidase [Agrococcus versicolor]|uniref:Abasic site processing protein n=1 Tax=Agrococcus versicolor TaxID=501482 RepID=A0ABP5MK84_9MICO